MALIADVVALKTGYANFVELKSAFTASQENADRMAMYRPTRRTAGRSSGFAGGYMSPMTRSFIC